MILAIDTSTDTASITVCDSGQIRAELTWYSRSRHSSTLTSALRQAFALAGRTVGDVTAVAVATGPGSFNGLRVGLSAGKGVAMARDVPLVGISTLDVIGFGASVASDHVWAAIPAGRSEVCVAEFVGTGDAWRRVSEYLRLPLAEAVELALRGGLLAGPAAHDLSDAATEQGNHLTVLPLPWNVPRAAYLAELCRRYLDAGGRSQLDDVEPLYLRLSAAEEKRAAATQE